MGDWLGNLCNIQRWDDFGSVVIGEARDTAVYRHYKEPPNPEGLWILRKEEESRKFPSIELIKTKCNNFLK